MVPTLVDEQYKSKAGKALVKMANGLSKDNGMNKWKGKQCQRNALEATTFIGGAASLTFNVLVISGMHCLPSNCCPQLTHAPFLSSSQARQQP